MRDILLLLIDAIVVLSFFINGLVLFVYKKIHPIIKILCLYFIINGSVEILSDIYSGIKENNLFLVHFSTLFDFVILSIFFNHLYKDLGKALNLKPLIISGVSLIVLNSFFIQNLSIFNSYSSTPVSILIILYCIYFFYLILEKNYDNNQFRLLKWGVICIFLFNSISLILILFGNFLAALPLDDQILVWLIRSGTILMTKLILIYYLARIGYEIYLKPKQINE